MRALLLIATLWAACSREPAATPLRIAAAADLAKALPEIGALFTAETGVEVVYSFGSSGLLAQQIEGGGPFDVFAAAQAHYVDELVETKRCRSRHVYGLGRLVVLGSTRAIALSELRDPRVVKIAIANPEHAPYGVAAREAMIASGLWEALTPRLIHAENARHALQLLESGNVEAAFVPLALVRASTASMGRAILVDEALHAPLVQTVAACGSRAPLGQRFIELMLSARGRDVLERHGFVSP